LAHSYRTLQHWNQWLTQHGLGERLLSAEQRLLTSMLKQQYGKHALLIGVSHQQSLLNATLLPYHTLLSPLISREHHVSYVEGDLHELPILTGSVDLVILPHTLEFIDNPRQLLAEACRVIKPEGLIVISGFNPYSMWGLKKLFTQKNAMPWTGNFIHSRRVKNWLRLADFKMEKQRSALFLPPTTSSSVYKQFHFLEKIGGKWCPFFGGVYILMARAKVIPLTPIKLKWKQQLGQIGIPRTMTGHVARSEPK
jgi:ubiquinone/menaquinone biosynthesis C-methylase UbiE